MTLKSKLSAGKTVWAAGIYDALSARIAETAGFDAVMTGGFGMTASLLGMPDFELLTLNENAGIVSRVAQAVGVPVIADIDTGYGNTINVQRAICDFKTAGAQAVIIEDQVSPKRCAACVEDTEIIPIDEAAAKIRAARHAGGPDLTVIGRTDSFDPAEAFARGRAYAAAGADLVQPVSKTFRDTEGLRELRRQCGVPLSIQILGWIESVPKAEIAEIAGLATFPLVALMTTSAALMANLKRLAADHDCSSLPLARMSMPDFNRFIGFDELLANQQRFYDPRPEDSSPR